MLEAILFDFDGVILESVALKGMAFARLYEDLGSEASKYVTDYHQKHGGVSRSEKIEHFNLRFGLSVEKKVIEEYCEKFSKLILAEICVCPFVPGALEFLETHSQKIHCFVVSATPQEELQKIIKLRHLDHHFKEGFGSPRKKPQLINEILRKNHWAKESVLFVGDALTDLNAAQVTGVQFLGRIIKGESDPFPCTIKKSADIFSDLNKMI